MAPSDVDPKIIDLLHDLGANDPQIERAAEANRLPALAVDLVLRRDFLLSVDEVAAQSGISTDDLLEIYRLFGISLDVSGPTLAANDLVLLSVLRGVGGPVGGMARGENFSLGAGKNLLRVIGLSISRIAEAAVSTFIQDVEAHLEATEVDLMEWVHTEQRVGEIAQEIGPVLGTLFIHHLLAAIQRQRQTQQDVSERSMVRLAVGFVDLVGFTPLAKRLSSTDLVALVTRFEERAFDIASSFDGRIIKHIGDEVMFTAVRVEDAARIALALIDEFATAVQPRGGLCYGEVLTLRGDYYGPIVNLAARLVDQAVPGEVLIDTASAGHLADVGHEPAGRRSLKGFDEPVSVCSLVTEPVLRQSPEPQG
jgi:class 3 adenylate cyclase